MSYADHNHTRKPMDAGEKCVDNDLKGKGHVSVVDEPDGNTPPDFLVDGHIVVEVRRLNQHESSEGKPRALSEVLIPFE